MAAVVIRKYGNRRLYDTSASRYVNLDEIAALIRDGHEIQVVDAKTGKDLTRVTLTQIITEDAKGQPTGLPLELLRQLILVTDKAGQEFVMWYLKSAFQTYEQLRDAVQSRFTDVQAALSPLQMMRDMIPGQLFGNRTADRELEELRKRVAELESRLRDTAERAGPLPKPQRGRIRGSGVRGRTSRKRVPS
jgi:polyhydroxyalkanoate synthesis repressor PhaR